MAIQILTDYRYLITEGHYSEDFLTERFLYWYRECKKIISSLKLAKSARVDTERLTLMVLSTFADIVRLQDFHPNIKKIRRIVDSAYSFYWLLRCSPIQLVDSVPKTGDMERLNSNFVNESLVVHLCVAEYIDRAQLHTPRLDRYMKELFYYFKYRNYNAQSLEAILTALVLGFGGDPFNDNGGQNGASGEQPVQS